MDRPELDDELWKLGSTAFEAKRYDEASDLFRRLVTGFPTHDRAYDAAYFRGQSYTNQKDWDKAIAATEKIDFQFEKEIICGNEVAYIGKIVTHIAGYISEAEGVFTYRADADGKMEALRAYWEVEATIASTRQA